MSLPLLMTLIDEACKSNSITVDTKNYLLKKAVEFGISTEIVEKMLSTKKINIIESSQIQNSTESVLSTMNASLRNKFSEYLTTSQYEIVISYFEEKLWGTFDYVLIEAYLKALTSTKEHQKAYTQSEKLKENIKSDIRKIYPVFGQIYLFTKKYTKAFDLYYSLSINEEPELQNHLDLLVKNVIKDHKYDLLDECRKNKNYLILLEEKLLEFFKCKEYLFYIQLFEQLHEDYFQSNDDLVKKYIWSLYKNSGTENKAYEKGNHYILKLTNPESLSEIMGLTCLYLEKWLEAYGFLKNCLSRNINVQNHIDKIIEKLIEKKEWQILSNFKDSINYQTRIEKLFDYYDNVRLTDYASMVNIFECFFFNTIEKNKIKSYITALLEIDIAKSLKKYKQYNTLFDASDKFWILKGAKIYEMNNEFETALDLYKKAESIEVGCCVDDIKRVNYILHPEVHFKDLYNDKKFLDAIKIFELKLKKTTDIDLIMPYISSLYKNEGTEEKGLEQGILYSKINSEGQKLYRTIGYICKYLKKNLQAKEYFTKAKLAGFNVDEELQEINLIIAKAEEEERKRKLEEERKRKQEEEERKRKLEEERKRKQEEEERKEREEEERKEKEEEERKEREEEERKERETEEAANSKIGSHEFESSTIRGGGVFFKQHIFVDDNEVTCKNRTGLISEKITIIPITKDVTVKIETDIIGSRIKIFGNGNECIQGENFTRSDVKEIASLIKKVQNNL